MGTLPFGCQVVGGEMIDGMSLRGPKKNREKACLPMTVPKLSRGPCTSLLDMGPRGTYLFHPTSSIQSTTAVLMSMRLDFSPFLHKFRRNLMEAQEDAGLMK